MTALRPHFSIKTRHRRIPTLAPDWGIIPQPSGNYVDGRIKCLPAEIRRVYGRFADVRFCLFLVSGPTGPVPLFSLGSASLSWSGSVQRRHKLPGTPTRDERRRLKWILANRSSVLRQTRGKQLCETTSAHEKLQLVSAVFIASGEPANCKIWTLNRLRGQGV